MKKLIYLSLIFFLFPSITWAQGEKVKAPIWNVGDKWVFTRGNIEVVGADQKTYTLKFSDDTSIIEKKKFEKIVFDKSTLNRIYALKEDKREKYIIAHKRILNFPINVGMEWKDTFTTQALTGDKKGETFKYEESFKILGWENVEVKAGNFKTAKIEYIQANLDRGYTGISFYWYAPEVKYFVKCQYAPGYFQGVADWELASFKLQK
jgi:hypothetical protein